jgi:hypothetical protein
LLEWICVVLSKTWFLKWNSAPIQSDDKPRVSFEKTAGWLFIGEGASAIVIKRASDCQTGQTRVYVNIDSICAEVTVE